MDIYVIDASSLIEMKDKYPQDTFPTVWVKMNKLYEEDRLIAPFEVKNEIQDDELKRWTIDKKKLFIRPSEKQIKMVKEVLEKFSFLAKPDKPGPNADPWLVALALEKSSEEKEKLFSDRKYLIVTEESKTKSDRIPAVCKDYMIECINLIELFRRERWKF